MALTGAAVGRGGKYGNRVDVGEMPRAEALAVADGLEKSVRPKVRQDTQL